ncbi:SPOR domain-containing protein [Sphingomonas sp. C3-2]|uniref:SPOR domain-containing protein n=1 Tax=Sphingomonas sp. C3-2 TaxID=3062169 RepID=UPI00294AF230|nr:SPOR domain-containing protein [Sphingomonas sp. C3-2]WOK36856.1 SPOR domain-containing protein [Sphingomonas sp. C3-2]
MMKKSGWFFAGLMLAATPPALAQVDAMPPSPELLLRADGGDADAQFDLGEFYKARAAGRGSDLVSAENWYRKAAGQGLPRAEDELGLVLFENGKPAEALPLLEKSAGRGDSRAEYLLGTILFNGDVAARDWVRAYALMLRSAASGLEQAGYTLTQMDQFIPVDDRRKAALLVRQAAIAVSDAPAPSHDAPGASYAAPRLPTMPAPATPPAPLPTEPKPVALADRSPVIAPAPPRPVTPRPNHASGGAWRIQLGAFSEADRASALWKTLRPKFGADAPAVHFVKTSGLTRVQIGPYASAADAQRECARLRRWGQAQCLPLKP